MSTVMAGAAEYERDVLIERINAGIRAAQARGVHCGQKRKLTKVQTDILTQLYEAGQSPMELALHFNLSIPTVYRYIKLQRAG